MLVDTHAHLTMSELAPDLPGVLERAAAAGIEAIVCVGIDLQSSRAALDLAERYEQVVATVGVHPNECAGLKPNWLEELRTMAASPVVAAIGEIGLDYYRDRVPRDRQQLVFEKQLEVAAELGLPVVVHNRAADGDLAPVLRRWSAGLTPSHPRGVLHCFSGDRTLMDEVVAAGFFVSFAGPITYLNAKSAAEMAAAAPWDRLLLETDSPYLAPHPHRGKRNEPAMVRLVAERMAQLRGESLERTIEIAGSNAARLFGLASAPAP
jgi:TatD DNase family protein